MRFSFLFSRILFAGAIALTPHLRAQGESASISAAIISPSLVALTPDVLLQEGIQLPAAETGAALGLIEILTGRSVLRSEKIPQKPFSLLIEQPITHAEALQAIETTLQMNDIAVTTLGDRFIKVVPLAAARIESPQLIEGSTLGMAPSGRIATKLFALGFVQVGQFGGKIAGLLNPQLGGVQVFEQANALLITDSISTLQRVEILVKELDQPNVDSLDPKFYPLVYAKASDLANKMRTILQGPAAQQLGTGTTFNADDRTNQIIVISDYRLHPFFDKLIARLDVRSDPNTRNEIIYLKHADATEVALSLIHIPSPRD